MSAHAFVIADYLDDIAAGFMVDDARRAVLGNYEAALRDVAQYHRWFVELRNLLYEVGCTCGERGECPYCRWRLNKRKGQR